MMPSGLQHTRAALLAKLPPDLRVQLRRCRDALRHVEARVRAHLPQLLGGPIGQEQLQCRDLMEHDRIALERLHAMPVEHFAKTAIHTDSVFVTGVYFRQQLIAAGFCRAIGQSQRPFSRALFYADYVHLGFRRRHVGRALHRARLAKLRALGAEEVFAWVDPDNPVALAALRACGFREVPQQPLWGRPTAAHQLLCRKLTD